jgi:hypothetical protein
MKKIYLALTAMLLITGCATVKTNQDEVSLNTAIREAAARMETRLDGGTKVALINFTSPSQAFSEYVLDELSSVLVNNGFLVVVDRANLDKIRQELGFNASGEVSDQSMQEIGQMLGAQALVTGSLTSINDLRRVMFKVIMTETAAVAVQHPADIINDKRVQALLSQGGGSKGLAYGGGSYGSANARGNGGSGGNSGSGNGSATQAVPAQATPTPAQTTYKIGDTGPAGGLIFYDKGNNSGGWRYLEAAPASTEKRTKLIDKYHYHGPDTFDENQTSEELGKGKENTEYLISRILFFGYWDTAAQICDDLVFGGYDDWYLPSIKELSYMYGNLVRKELGGFRETFYWSSSGNDGRGGGQISYGGLVMNMQNGAQDKRAGESVNQQLYVRACRRF